MNEPLKIECEWWGAPESANDAAGACRAGIGIRLGEFCLTRLDDLRGNTVRSRMHGCALTLGEWFAGNWWRLRWEPESRHSTTDLDWRMSHGMAAAGGGFIWPNILFASDGESIAVVSRPGAVVAEETPVRYLNWVDGRISAKGFEQSVDDFMGLVLTRLHGEGFRNSDLAQLWAEVLNERQDEKLAVWRRLEAICGYDPGDAPSELVQSLIDDKLSLGRGALQEVAAHCRHETAGALLSIHDLPPVTGKSTGGGFRCKPLVLKRKPTRPAGLRPWQWASRLAAAARQEWNLGANPVSNMHLAGFLRTHASAFKDRAAKADAPMPLALRRSRGDGVDFFVASSWGTSRRFAASRLLGQWLDLAGDTERLIPATEAKTANQQFQRAFAQELLCPFDALVARLQTTQPGHDQIEDAAQYFGVSPLAVRTTLVNKGELDRESLNWAN
jgi:hypothetical protein